MTAGAASVALVDSVTLPTRRDEAWRYAPHSDLAALTFVPTPAPASVSADVLAQIPETGGPRIVLVNGALSVEHSVLDALPDGCSVVPFGDAAGSAAALLDAHYGVVANTPSDAFATINSAYGTDGVVIEIADDVDCADPVQVVDVVVGSVAQQATSSGLVISLGARSSATIIETKIGGGDVIAATNSRTTVTLGEDAVCKHIVLQDLAPQQVGLARIGVEQSEGSQLVARSFNLGGSYSRLAYDVRLAGEGTRADLAGLYFGFGDQTLDQQINVVHAAKNTSSAQSFRGVLDDESTGIFNGGIDVLPGADGTDAEQANDNLLLSKRAEVNTQPRLEILADEVKCTHGATVGQLDETALYYMRSRGIDADTARRLLIAGFARSVVDDVEIESVQRWVTTRLGQGDG